MRYCGRAVIVRLRHIAKACRLSVTSLNHAVANLDTEDLLTRLTLVLTLLSSGVAGTVWPFKLLLHTAAIAGLCFPPLHRAPGIWWFVATVMSWKTLHNWWDQDNHLFLFTYWCLALALSRSLKNRTQVLATNGRLLIGCSFVCAVVWKGFLSGDFFDSTFFYHALLTDSRFYHFGRIFGGMHEALAQFNHTVLHEFATSATATATAQLQSPPQLWFLAQSITWWTLGCESILALVFLCPVTSQLSRYRHAFLLLFAWTTYLVATVETFGWLLMILGLAQCEPDHHRTRLLYVMTCGVILAYDYMPWLSFLPSLRGSGL